MIVWLLLRPLRLYMMWRAASRAAATLHDGCTWETDGAKIRARRVRSAQSRLRRYYAVKRLPIVSARWLLTPRFVSIIVIGTVGHPGGEFRAAGYHDFVTGLRFRTISRMIRQRRHCHLSVRRIDDQQHGRVVTALLISVVAPVYTKAHAARIVGRLIGYRVRLPIGNTFEFILVDDGSTDNSLETARALVAEELASASIELRRNFGQTAAATGRSAAGRGNIVISMDSDLQHFPRRHT